MLYPVLLNSAWRFCRYYYKKLTNPAKLKYFLTERHGYAESCLPGSAVLSGFDVFSIEDSPGVVTSEKK